MIDSEYMEIWHPFDNKWVHIVQEVIVADMVKRYYTDGVLVKQHTVIIDNKEGISK